MEVHGKARGDYRGVVFATYTFQEREIIRKSDKQKNNPKIDVPSFSPKNPQRIVIIIAKRKKEKKLCVCLSEERRKSSLLGLVSLYLRGNGSS